MSAPTQPKPVALFFKDVKRFLFALLPHWYKVLAVIVGEVVLCLVSLGGLVIPPWAIGCIVASGLVAACFFAWRGQQRIIDQLEGKMPIDGVLPLEVAVKTFPAGNDSFVAAPRN